MRAILRFGILGSACRLSRRPSADTPEGVISPFAADGGRSIILICVALTTVETRPRWSVWRVWLPARSNVVTVAKPRAS